MNSLISVADRIPEHEDHVLVYIYPIGYDIDWYDHEWNRWAKVRRPGHSVTYWMEFPPIPVKTENTQP